MKKSIWVILGILAVLVIVRTLVWPVIDRELMTIPMTDGITAVQNTNMPGMRNCFTSDALIGIEEKDVAVATVLNVAEPMMKEHKDVGPLRFGGYDHLRALGNVAMADFTVFYDHQGDDIPYRSVPVRITGQVTLERVSVFSWKIKHIGFKEQFLGDLLDTENLNGHTEGGAE
ncbi:MAG TPA: hypothetical protein VHV83_04645 [Armatimonadota bacterium]|nr:hypothetical protein [Armatimonadota bacterium]